MEKEENTAPAQTAAAWDDDEISLADVWHVITQQRYLILGVLAVFIAGALVLAFLLPPVYRADVHLLPPESGDIQAVNIPGVYTTDPEAVYKAFLQNLQSRSLLRRYFDRENIVERLAPDRSPEETPDRIFDNAFYERVQLDTGRNRNGEPLSFVRFSLGAPEAALASDWANGVVALTAEKTVSTLLADVAARVRAETENLERQIASARRFARERRLDRIARLEEAAAIAETIGVTERVTATNLRGDGVKTRSDLAINLTTLPLYLRGTRELLAEASALRARKSDDPFIGKLRDWQERLDVLSKIQPSPAGILAARIDQAALTPEKAESPNKILILILGVVLGLMAGFFAALLRNAFQPRENLTPKRVANTAVSPARTDA